jgi:hypothetical protein
MNPDPNTPNPVNNPVQPQVAPSSVPLPITPQVEPVAVNTAPTPQPATAAQPAVQQTQAAQIPASGLSLDKVDSGVTKFLVRKLYFVIPVLILAVGLSFANVGFGFAILLLGFLVAKTFYEKSLFGAFANSNKFTFQKNGVVPVQTGHLFYIGNSNKISDVVSGSYIGWPFLLFLYAYDIGYGKNRRSYHRAVLTINYGVKLPTFILRRSGIKRLLNEEGDKIKANGYTEKLQLEGDFNKHFVVFIPPNTGQDALTILTPDVMELLLPLDKYEIELTTTGEFYLYTYKFITKKQELIDIYKIVQVITSKLGNVANLQKIIIKQPTNSPDPYITTRT